MNKEKFLDHLRRHKEDKYTDFFYYEWIAKEDGKEKFLSFLVGDVTQI